MCQIAQCDHEPLVFGIGKRKKQADSNRFHGGALDFVSQGFKRGPGPSNANNNVATTFYQQAQPWFEATVKAWYKNATGSDYAAPVKPDPVTTAKT